MPIEYNFLDVDLNWITNKSDEGVKLALVRSKWSVLECVNRNELGMFCVKSYTKKKTIFDQNFKRILKVFRVLTSLAYGEQCTKL